jgi:hypothetical protein
MVNEKLLEIIGKTEIEFLNGGVSYHSPTLISIGKLLSFGHKPFTFFGFWAERADFLSWVEEGWQTGVDGLANSIMYSVKNVLKAKNIEVFGDTKQMVLLAKENLEFAQRGVLNSLGIVAIVLKERECLHEFVSISKAEEAFPK